MATREEKIAFIQSKMNPAPSSQSGPTREEKIAFIQSKMAQGQTADEEKGMLSRLGDAALEGVSAAGRFVDTYTGAPTRAAISAAQEGQNPVSAFGKQFGEDPSNAPTGKDIARRAGVPDNALSEALPGAFTDDPVEAEKWYKFQRGGPADITASGAAGLGIDVIADPINLVPGGAIAKGAKGAEEVISRGSKIASKLGEKLGKNSARGATKVGSALTGVSEKEIETYAKHSDEINKIAKSADHDAQEMADQLRVKLNETVQSHKKQLNDQITKALESAPKEKNIDITPVINSLEKYKARLDPKLDPEAIREIDDLLSRVRGTTVQAEKAPTLGYLAPNEKFAVKMGNTTELMNEVPKKYTQRLKGKVDSIESVPVTYESSVRQSYPGEALFPVGKDEIIELPVGGNSGPKYMANTETLQKIKTFLKDQASGSFGSTPTGFQVGTRGANAAKSAMHEANQLINVHAPKSIASANKGLSRLHEIEDVMNKSMLAEGKNASSLYAAGSGGNAANAKVLRQLGEETGTDMLGEAEKLAAARTFGKPSLLPVDATGKTFTRVALGAAGGSLVGGPVGSALGIMFTSPAVLKQAIKTGKVSSEVIQKLAGGAKNITDDVIEKAVKAANTEKGQAIIRTLEKAPKAESVQKYNEVAESKTRPLKGSEKWANDGLNKLKESGAKVDASLLENPKAKKLLIAASDLKPGSKAMNNIVSELEKLKGKR